MNMSICKAGKKAMHAGKLLQCSRASIREKQSEKKNRKQDEFFSESKKCMQKLCIS